MVKLTEALRTLEEMSVGRSAAVRVIYENGLVEKRESIEDRETLDDTKRFEYEYMYGPDLLPPLSWSSDGMWRYHALLPIENKGLYPLAVGGTPLIAPARIREWASIPCLWLKDETRSPTGSNKDRATALILEKALQMQVHTVSCASTGNVAVSLAIGAAASAIDAVIFVPANISSVKLHLMLCAGAV